MEGDKEKAKGVLRDIPHDDGHVEGAPTEVIPQADTEAEQREMELAFPLIDAQQERWIQYLKQKGWTPPPNPEGAWVDPGPSDAKPSPLSPMSRPEAPKPVINTTPASTPISTLNIPKSNLPRLEKFDGEDYIDDWLLRFNQHAKLHGWTPEQQVVILPLHLTGIAQQWHTMWLRGRLHLQTDLPQLITALKEQFKPIEDKTYWRRALQQRKQAPGEEVMKFSIAFNSLCQKANPYLEDADKCAMFIEALQEDIQTLMMVKMPKTYIEAVQEARKLEAVVQNRTQ